MKLVFLVDESFNKKNHLGVQKKVYSQIDMMNRNGIEAQLLHFKWVNGRPDFEIPLDTDILYFRNVGFSVRFAQKLSDLRKNNPNIQIIMEIPTYPFLGEYVEMKSIKQTINEFLGKFIMCCLINRIVLIGQEKKQKRLFGVKVIHANNGVDFSKVKGKKVENLSDDEIHVMCVSGCYFWHGYERFIEGLAKYEKENTGTRKIYFHMVGDGECLNNYISLAKKCHLYGTKIFIYGNKSGDELDRIYDQCDIALDGLGWHRKGLTYLTSLKTREYAAKGIPMASSAMLDIENEKTKKYVLTLPATEDPIDMSLIIKFYDSVYKGVEKKKIPEQMRKEFYKITDWEYTYKDAIDYMKNIR